MPNTKPQARRKIPRGEARRATLLADAARIILRDGLDRVSMDVIADGAGASKATLYRHFGDKHGLVVEVVEYLCADFLSDVGRDLPEAEDLRSGLTAILGELVDVMSKPDHPSFMHLIVVGGQIDPDIGRTWFQHGPQVWHRLMRNLFEAQRASGAIPAGADISDYPEMLFDAVFADMLVSTAITREEAKPRALRDRYLERLVDSVVTAVERQA